MPPPQKTPIDWSSPERQRLVAIDQRMQHLREELALPPPSKRPFVVNPFEEDARKFREDLKKGSKDWQRAKALARSRTPVSAEELAFSPLNTMIASAAKYHVISSSSTTGGVVTPSLSLAASSPVPSASATPGPSPAPSVVAGHYQSPSPLPSLAASTSPARFHGTATALSQRPWQVPKVDKVKVKDHYLRAYGLHRNNLILYSDVAKNNFDHNKFHGKPSVDFEFKYSDFEV